MNVAIDEYEKGKASVIRSSMDPYIWAGFNRKIKIKKENIILDSGEVLCPGDRVIYLGGEKTSAGFDDLSLQEGTLEYKGMETIEGDSIALFERAVKNNFNIASESFSGVQGFEHLFFGLFVEKVENRLFFFYTNLAGAGRIIETTNSKIEKK